MSTISKFVVAFCCLLLAGVAVVVGGGVAASRFWNLVAPDLFGAPQATWANGAGALGLLLCARMCLVISRE